LRATDAALLIVALVIAWSLYRAHKGNDAYFANFNLVDLLLENGRVSKLACVFMGSFAVSSWIMVRMTFDGKMTEGLFMAYGGVWVAPVIAKLFTPPTQTATATSTTSVSTTVTP